MTTLLAKPIVTASAAGANPTPNRGETVKAFVSLRDGATAGADDLITYCRQRLAAYKFPRTVQFLDDIPKTATGKILRRALPDDESAPAGS